MSDLHYAYTPNNKRVYCAGFHNIKTYDDLKSVTLCDRCFEIAECHLEINSIDRQLQEQIKMMKTINDTFLRLINERTKETDSMVDDFLK